MLPSSQVDVAGGGQLRAAADAPALSVVLIATVVPIAVCVAGGVVLALLFRRRRRAAPSRVGLRKAPGARQAPALPPPLTLVEVVPEVPAAAPAAAGNPEPTPLEAHMAWLLAREAALDSPSAKGAGLARARLERALVAERKGEETNDWLAKAMRRLSDETRDGVHQRTLARSLSAASLPEKRAQRRSKSFGRDGVVGV